MIGSIAVIIGAGVVAALLLFMIFKLGERSDPKERHGILQLLLLFFFATMIMLVGKSVNDEANYCNWNVANSTVAGSTTSYNYVYDCSANDNSTNTIFYKSMLWFVRLFATYIVIYFIYSVLLYAGVVVPK